jgi:FkbM family methyltransferase
MNLKKQIKARIQSEIRKKGFRINNIFYFNYLESLLYQYILKYKSINFIQIGANDGKRFDPIHEFITYNKDNISGYVIEPIYDYFMELCDTYKDYPNIKPLNFAIHNDLSEAIIYKVAKEFEGIVPEFALGIASFDQNHHKKTNIPSKFLLEEKVKCMSISDLMECYSVVDVNLLVLDTEGYDYNILINIDFNIIAPSIIHFEHGLKSGTMSIDQFEELKTLFNKNDYQLFVNETDVTAIKTFLFYE